MNYLLVLLGGLMAFNLFVEPPMENSMIYFPTKEMAETPSSIGIQYEDVFLKTPDGKNIHGWFMDNVDSEKVILYFHGNGGNISDNLAPVKTLYRLPAAVLIIDYHGYGNSEGQPSEKNLSLDAKSAYAFLREQKKYSPEKIILFGRSLGGAVALELATTEKVGGIILLSSFTSLRDMANLTLPVYLRPLVWLKADFNCLENIKRIKAPGLIIHSKKDEMIPYEMALALYQKANEPKQLLSLEAGGHNDWIESEELLESLRRFLKQ